MRYFLAILAVSIVAVVGVLGFRGSHFRKPSLYIFPDMEWQLKLRPQKANSFFTNGLSSQYHLPGTIARSTPLATPAGSVYPFEDSPVNTGQVTGTTNFIENNPLPITAELLKRGQQRFTINCSPCHGALGDGNGIIPQRGYRHPPSYHIERLRKAPLGYFFDVMTNGFGQMSSYATQVPPDDRWAIVAWVKTLQASQNMPREFLGREDENSLEGKEAEAGVTIFGSGGQA